jgi:Uma2 family endonuclease
MAERLLESEPTVETPDITHLVTEDDKPVDNIPSEKQQRLLVEPLYSSWNVERPFLAASNVAIFRTVHRPPVVPDMFLSLDVQVAEDWWAKENRSYFIWEFGKSPEVVLEIVSNRKGQETDEKFREYAGMGALYYVIYDPQQLLQPETLRVYQLQVGEYVQKKDWQLEKVGLGLTLWEGVFEGKKAQWLRWSDLEGQIIPTGAERAEQEWERAEAAEAELARLRARLAELGDTSIE